MNTIISIQERQTTSLPKPDLKQFQIWREEAMMASSLWREESWRDCEMYDGYQWSDADRHKAIDAGLPYILTINRTFPAVNLLLGSQVMNKYDIIAKGRTIKDSEISQVMTEGIKYVMDQWDGQAKITMAFRDEVIPGIGWISPGYSNDPRRERVKISYRDWKEVWWDPYSSPWVDIETCRYLFYQRWMDVTDLQALFPEKSQEIEEASKELSAMSVHPRFSTVWDEASQKEEEIRYSIGTGWVQSSRKRVRPCEIWYTVFSTGIYAIFPNGNVLEVKPDMDPLEQFAMIRSASEVVSATVKKLRVAVFLADLLISDSPSPYSHDQYPFVPFVCYLDRWNFPYGVPRQLRDQEEEINRRRSMALALLNSRRVTVEEDAVTSHMGLQDLYEEANKPDGFLIVSPGSNQSQKILIHDQAQLAAPQVALLEQSEREIQEISGANAEQMGYKSNAISGRAIELRQVQGATVTAPIFENYRRSLSILGTQICSLIKGAWTGEKVLRITDRLSGAEKFVALNQRFIDQQTGTVFINNDITQGMFDIIVSDAPITDTIREQNMLMIIEWIKKSPPEIIPHLILVAMEMSNIPNKDLILAKIKPLLGQDPTDEDLSPEQLKQKAIQQLEIQSQKAALMESLQLSGIKLDLQNKEVTNKKLEAEIQKILASIATDVSKAQSQKEKVDVARERVTLDSMRTGFDMQDKVHERKLQLLETINNSDKSPKSSSKSKSSPPKRAEGPDQPSTTSALSPPETFGNSNPSTSMGSTSGLRQGAI